MCRTIQIFLQFSECLDAFVAIQNNARFELSVGQKTLFLAGGAGNQGAEKTSAVFPATEISREYFYWTGSCLLTSDSVTLFCILVRY